MGWRRKRLYVAQMSVVEYVEGRREQFLMKRLSFYFLVDMMLVS